MREGSQSNVSSGIFIGGVDAADRKLPERPGLHVPWSWLSLGMLVLTITSLGVLSVIVGIKDVDILSTVALALAVLAFAAQLIVSLAQAQGSAQQLNQTERVNSETRSALAEVKSTANALLTNQSDQFNKVLSALLRSATEDAVREAAEASAVMDAQGVGGAGVIDPEAVAERVEERVKMLLANQPGRVGGETRDRASLYGLLSEDGGERAVAAYRDISPGALLLFLNIVSGLESYSEFSRAISLRVPTGEEVPALQELFNKKLLHHRSPAHDRRIVQLTNRGKVLTVLLLSSHFREDWYWREISLMSNPPSSTA